MYGHLIVRNLRPVCSVLAPNASEADIAGEAASDASSLSWICIECSDPSGDANNERRQLVILRLPYGSSASNGTSAEDDKGKQIQQLQGGNDLSKAMLLCCVGSKDASIGMTRLKVCGTPSS